MAGERRINWGADATAARYRTEDTGDGANFVVAEDLDGGTVLLEYDDSRTPSEWVVRGPVDLDGNDLSAGAIDAESVSTEEQRTTKTSGKIYSSDNQIITSSSITQVDFNDVAFDEFEAFDPLEHEFVCPENGTWYFEASIQFSGESGNPSVDFNNDRVFIDIVDVAGGSGTRNDQRGFTQDGRTLLSRPAIYQLDEGDTVLVEVFQNSASDVGLTSSNLVQEFKYGRLG